MDAATTQRTCHPHQPTTRYSPLYPCMIRASVWHESASFVACGMHNFENVTDRICEMLQLRDMVEDWTCSWLRLPYFIEFYVTSACTLHCRMILRLRGTVVERWSFTAELLNFPCRAFDLQLTGDHLCG